MPIVKSLIELSINQIVPISDEDFVPFLEKGKSILNDFIKGEFCDDIGWLTYPSSLSSSDIRQIKESAASLSSFCDTIVVVGIGGSYLGAKSVISSLSPYFSLAPSKTPELIFAGINLSGQYLKELLAYLESRSFAIIVISKSGSTLESLLTFRLLENLLQQRYGVEQARLRTIIVTDPLKGALRQTAIDDQYASFPIPSSIGGRFSVLTTAGLLPMAISGIDIKEIIAGAVDMQKNLLDLSLSSRDNIAILYAAYRQYLYQKEGKKIELLASFDPKLSLIGEWWKQLFAESEGKEGKGIFVSTATFTTDLHAVGQWIQQGERTIFETLLTLKQDKNDFHLPLLEGKKDNLWNSLKGFTLSHINKSAELGTIDAHTQGEVPVITITLDSLDAYSLGALIYFFEVAVAISGRIMDINPFDQPGVEAYKERMTTFLHRGTTPLISNQ